MDDGRLRELNEKAQTSGLSDAEASELGRLLAEDENAPYGDAGDERRVQSEADQPLKARKMRRTRWAMGTFGSRNAWPARSQELAHTDTPTEDLRRQA
jgi:hypothetical protein